MERMRTKKKKKPAYTTQRLREIKYNILSRNEKRKKVWDEVLKKSIDAGVIPDEEMLKKAYVTSPVRAFRIYQNNSDKIHDLSAIEWNVCQYGFKPGDAEKILYYLTGISPKDYSDCEDYLLLSVDLRKSKDAILDNFKKLLDFHLKKKGNRVRIKEWELDLQVWDEWVRSEVSARKSFPAISKRLNIPISTIKSRWYKAYELIYRKKYDLKAFKEKNKQKAEELCSRCEDAICYKGSHADNWIGCKAYLNIAGKDYLREILKNNDQLDFLTYKDKYSKQKTRKRLSTGKNLKTILKCPQCQTAYPISVDNNECPFCNVSLIQTT